MDSSDQELAAPGFRCGEYVFATREEAEAFKAWDEARRAKWDADCQRHSADQLERFTAKTVDKHARVKAALKRTGSEVTKVDGYVYRRSEFRTLLVRQAPPQSKGSRPRTPRSRRTVRRATARGPDGREPEPESPRLCAGCGKEIHGRRKDARTHGPACRKAASRAARAAAPLPVDELERYWLERFSQDEIDAMWAALSLWFDDLGSLEQVAA